MSTKKNSRYDLESKRSAFFTLGLLVTGSMTLAAFTYSDPMLKADKGNDVKRELIAIDYQVEPEKPKDDVQTPDHPIVDNSQTQSTIDARTPVGTVIQITTNTATTITSGVSTETGGLLTGPIITKGGTHTVIDPEKIEDIVDIEAEFKGGVEQMIRYIQKNVNYPSESIRLKEQGKVYVAFVVEKDGSITNVEVERGISDALDREAKKVVRDFPNWIPGEIKMQKVRTRVRLPITFILD